MGQGVPKPLDVRLLARGAKSDFEAGDLQFAFADIKSLTTEQKEEISSRAQKVVNEIQMRELGEMIALLNEILDDPKQKYYLVVDRLDEDWVEDRLRYGLIKALLETVREFHKVRNAKVIVALRLDLIDRVFSATRDPGYQAEKYEGEILRLGWTKPELTNVLDRRVSHLVQRRYTKGEVNHRDVLPNRVGRQPTIDYMLDRTLMRPRDLINFFNACIPYADGQPQVSANAIAEAEGEYSRSRLQALADEWHTDYPNLLACCVPLLRNRPPLFEFASVTPDEISNICLTSVTTKSFEHPDRISVAAMDVAEGRTDPMDYWLNAVEMFYRVGLVGLKVDQNQPIEWSIDGRRTISTAEIGIYTRIAVHKCFWRVLGVSDRRGEAVVMG